MTVALLGDAKVASLALALNVMMMMKVLALSLMSLAFLAPLAVAPLALLALVVASARRLTWLSPRRLLRCPSGCRRL